LAKAKRKDVSTATDIAVLAARLEVLELALVTLSAENDELRADYERIAEATAGGFRAVDENFAVVAPAVDDVRGRVDELEGATVNRDELWATAFKAGAAL
jgi:hypothetical protein